jgi:large subunit ribosomal protein L23
VSSMDRLYRIVATPIVSEKGANDAARRNAYQFRVPVDATKIEIRTAVEKVFNVKVLKINTLRMPQKVRRRGYSFGMTPAWKKAMVVLDEGQVIDVL